MKYMTYLTRNDAGFDDVAWVLSQHVKIPDTGEFNTAVLYGNEDYPTEVVFYKWLFGFECASYRRSIWVLLTKVNQGNSIQRLRR